MIYDIVLYSRVCQIRLAEPMELNFCFDRYGCIMAVLGQLFVCTEAFHSDVIGCFFFFLGPLKRGNAMQNRPIYLPKTALIIAWTPYTPCVILSSSYLCKSWMDKEASSCGTFNFGLFPHIKPWTETHTHTHTEFGLPVNRAGNIICWGTAAGWLQR